MGMKWNCLIHSTRAGLARSGLVGRSHQQSFFPSSTNQKSLVFVEGRKLLNWRAPPFSASAVFIHQFHFIALIHSFYFYNKEKILSFLLLFVFGWAAVISSSLMREDEQPTQPNQLLAFISAAIGGCWLIKERVGELPSSFELLWVIGRRPLCAAPLHSKEINFFFITGSLPSCLFLKRRRNKVNWLNKWN